MSQGCSSSSSSSTASPSGPAASSTTGMAIVIYVPGMLTDICQARVHRFITDKFNGSKIISSLQTKKVVVSLEGENAEFTLENITQCITDAKFSVESAPADPILFSSMKNTSNKKPHKASLKIQTIEADIGCEDCVVDIRNKLAAIDSLSGIMSKLTISEQTKTVQFEGTLDQAEIAAEALRTGKIDRKPKVLGVRDEEEVQPEPVVVSASTGNGNDADDDASADTANNARSNTLKRKNR